MCHMFHIQTSVKQGDALLPLLFNLALEYVIRKVKKIRRNWYLMKHISSWFMLMIIYLVKI